MVHFVQNIVNDFIIPLAVGIASSLLATWILTTKMVKPVLERYKKLIEKLINPVSEFTSGETFVKLLKEAIDEFNDDYSRFIIYRALPCEITENFLDRLEEPPSSNDLYYYRNKIREIIREGRGSYDKTIFGKTNIRDIDIATKKAILSDYYPEIQPGTTELGLHDNLNEIGIILLGKTESSKDIGNIEWQSGFIIIFSADFKRIRGFLYRVSSHINNLLFIFKEKQKDSEENGLYKDFDNIDSNEYDDFKRTIESFFCFL